MIIMNRVMTPATNHHPPLTFTPPQNHPPLPQNHSSPPENHFSQNLQSLSIPLANHQQNPTMPQNYFPLPNLEFFLHKMTENQEKHHQQVVQLLHRALAPSSFTQNTHCTVPYNGSVVATVSADLLHKTDPQTVQSPATGTQLFPACPHISNTILRLPEAVPSHTAAPGNFSPSGVTISSSPQLSSCITRSVTPSSGTPDAQFTFSPVDTIIFNQKNPFSGASLVNTHGQPQSPSSLASHAPFIDVSVGDNTPSQSFVENGIFPPFFSQNDQQNPQLCSGFSQQFLTSGSSASGGNLLHKLPENNLPLAAQKTTSLFNGFPTITTLQNSTATPALTAQCTDAVTVQSTPAFSSFPATTGAQGSIQPFTQLCTQPLTSLSTSCTTCAHPANHTLIPIVSHTSSTPNDPVQTPFSVTSAKLVDSQPSSPKQTKTNFASLFNHSSSSSPIPLAPLPTPYTKGSLPAIKLNEEIFQNSLKACDLNLIGRLSLPKGSDLGSIVEF